ncbi:MAG: bifunctional UDP-N-acetylglucosamine diphosphorylase/glucosamine-1-phosphate N-acetyltransferase GlmU [Caulobacteraceae bacterium]|nr:bifunctional UDP-N-acetylglucosamine diphosphorylase/glucosamine-1-phosphate N-acetyltransferase GlmU [Caulobacteraceae bacterium]
MDTPGMERRAAVILAAGQGTRMRSATPKVLHPVGGRSMLDRAIDAAQGLGCAPVVVVVGAHSPQVGEHVERRLGPGSTALQDPPLGTGHAVRSAEAALANFDGDVVITYADVPLLDDTAMSALFSVRAEGADIAVLGFHAEDPGAYGRLVMGFGDDLAAIVEAKDATPEQLHISLCNSGVMALPARLLFELLAEVTNDNAKGEFYLTDIVALARARKLHCRVAVAAEEDVMGVNSQVELAIAESIFQTRRRGELLEAGVSMTAPETVYLAFDTEVAGGVQIEPNVVFGPGVRVEAGARIRAFSHLEGCTVREGAEVGPYARLRPKADIGPKAKVGNFVEVKNVTMGAGAKANHLAYLGDGEVGAKANIGAGTIFCNYDGFGKAKTTVGEGAFVGSNSSLVAPVSIGAGAYVGSGSVVTKDVSADALAFERSDQIEKPGWAKRFREAKSARKDKA